MWKCKGREGFKRGKRYDKAVVGIRNLKKPLIKGSGR